MAVKRNIADVEEQDGHGDRNNRVFQSGTQENRWDIEQEEVLESGSVQYEA